MGDRTFNVETYRAVAASVAAEGGSATARGEQRHKEGKGLDPLVDPKGFGAIRRSLNRFREVGGGFRLTVGQSMLKETRFDTTGSMGINVQHAFDSLPRSFHLLKEVRNAPLGRYDLQIINAIFGDVTDHYVLCRSQAEMDEKIVEQLRLMVPERDGGDSPEDPEYGLFGAAYLTDAAINQIDLKSYDFTVTDATSHGRITFTKLKEVFGDDVLEIVASNGLQIKSGSLPDTKRIVTDLKKRAHAFMLVVGDGAARYWTSFYGPEHVVVMPSTDHLPEYEATIIGLTEGTITLQTAKQFLIEHANLSERKANEIVRAVAHIPLGAQAALPNFDRIPKAGDFFRSKTDPWPADDAPALDKPGDKNDWL